jgi:cystathionine gamma-lyase
VRVPAPSASDDDPGRRPGTRAVHAGLPEPVQGEPFLPGPVLASTYHLAGAADAAAFVYNRMGNPTWEAYERALGELEGGEAVLFASGMAAVAAVVVPGLGAGDAVVVPADGYPGVRTLAAEHLAPRGVEVRSVATRDAEILGALEGAALVWLETPSNPALEVCDVAAVAAAAHAAGALVVVDNTLATPLGQRPLELGADLSVCSGSKQLTGHSDLTLGYVAAADAEHAAAARAWRTRTGAVAGPFEAWLAHRSLPTLDLRVGRASATARALAELLAARGDVSGVRYPGLPGDPSFEVASRQMRHAGPVVCFALESHERAQRFLTACRLVFEATSFGGVHSTAERRARWGTDAVPEGFIRFSVGCEDPEDLLADVAQALDASAA